VETPHHRRMWWARSSLLALAAVVVGCAPSVYDAPYLNDPLELPRDDASHTAPVEWWYWVGQLVTEDGRRLAFQLTFFEAYAPPYPRLAGVPADWLIEKGMVAHAAVADLDTDQHRMAQRGFAMWDGASSVHDLELWVGDWRADRGEDGVSHALKFTVGRHAFELNLTPTKPAVLHGEPPGWLSMGPGGVSAYVSHTRMQVGGVVRGPCSWPALCPAVTATGQAWFDHQWGDFRIDRFAGWDWFALQLDDGAEVMVYRIRDADGRPVSTLGSYVAPDGATFPLGEDDIELVVAGAKWTSPTTGARYPAGWHLRVPSFAVDATIFPAFADQEMDTRATTGIVYWEGAVVVSGESAGVGFVELTNYDRVPADPRR